MDKQTLLQQIQDAVANRLINKREILTAYRQGIRATTSEINIFKILCYLGAAIIGLGAIILLGQHWDGLPISTKLLATLGVGFAAYYGGVIFGDDERLFSIDQVFYLVSGLVLPVGFYVWFKHLGYDVIADSVRSLIAVILLSIYLFSFFIFRKIILLIFSIVFATAWLFYLAGFVGGPWLANKDLFFEYRWLVIGFGYLCLGYYFARTRYATLSGVLYGFGSFFFLGMALWLGAWFPNQNIVWEIIFPFLALGIALSSVYLKSKSCLVFGAIYLVLYILKITDEYFARSMGWPIALMFAGVTLIGVGCCLFYVYRKYFGGLPALKS